MISANKYLVTIIIPTFNRANLLQEALNSVFAQTYKNFEIIVVDDGSTDNTKEVLAPLVESRAIRYIFQKNQGRSAARNRGIREAVGVFLAFLDSDDLFEPDKLQKQVEFLSRNPGLGLVHGGYTKFDEHNDNLGYRNPEWFSGWIYPDLLLQWLTLIAIPTVMVPKTVIEEVGGFDERLYIGEDLDLWRRIARRYPFGFINQSLARIRVHAGNTSADVIGATKEFERYLEKAFDDDPHLSKRFRHRVFSRMFSNQAYILLSGNEIKFLQAARLNGRRAIAENPLNLHGYIAFFSSLFGYELRQALILRWRSVRALIMSRNRSA